MRPVLVVLPALLGALALAAPAGAAAAQPTTSCFWYGPYATERGPQFNSALPDSGAVYWTSRFQLPDGATLRLKGTYAHARYQSLNAYGSDAAPTDALNDVSTRPDAGSANPFRPGADRRAARRSYTATIVGTPPPATGAGRAANTLYAGVPGQVEQRLIYRVYLPDRGRDRTGGAGLPAPEVVLADGTTLSGAQACATLQVVDGTLPLTTLPQDVYRSLRNQPGRPSTFPAANPPVFRAFYNVGFSIACVYRGECGGTPVRTGGQYSNIDNQYVSAGVNRGHGKVLVLRGRLPTTPRTLAGQRRMGTGQLRYWSLCQNESLYTTRGAGCLYDEQLRVDRKGFYTIVTSRPGDRPRNATTRCGVGYIPWPAAGDGDGNLDDGLLILRNMLPATGFRQAVQRTKVPGDEAKVMGAYLPRGTYTSKAAFERRGC